MHSGEYQGKGTILTTLAVDGAGFAEIAVSDNGKGFPREDRHRLVEPYVTTRAEEPASACRSWSRYSRTTAAGSIRSRLARVDGERGARVFMKIALASPR